MKVKTARECLLAIVDKLNINSFLELSLGKSYVNHIDVPLKVKVTKSAIYPRDFKNSFGFRCYSMEFERFFSEFKQLPDGTKSFDLIFVDNNHNPDEKTISNAINILSGNGIIVAKDFKPRDKITGMSVKEFKETGYRGSWVGESWKTIVMLRSKRDDILITTFDLDWGTAIIFKTNLPQTMLNFSDDEINAMSFEDFETNLEAFINLKPADDFELFLSNYKNQTSPPKPLCEHFNENLGQYFNISPVYKF